MFFLEGIPVCENPNVLKILLYFRTILTILSIVIPMALIVILSIDIFKGVVGNEDTLKKTYSTAIKRIISALIIFLVPVIMNIVVSLLDSTLNALNLSDKITSCWTNANTDAIKNYQVTYDQYKCTERGGTWDATNNTCDMNTDSSPDDDPNNNNNPAVATIYVGDSRTNGMCTPTTGVSLEANEQCVAYDGGNLIWFNSGLNGSVSGRSRVNAILGTSAITYNIVIYLGVNDLNAQQYISMLNGLLTTWGKHHIIVVSVTKTDPSKYSGGATNQKISDFNNAVKNGLNSGITYCNIYDKVPIASDSTTDGLHYTQSTYQKVYDEMNKCF